jgi:hypothetical protein
LHAAAEVAGIECDETVPRQALTEKMCLPLSAITQGRVQLALDPAISIPIGLSMAHEEQA